ncbi:MAG: hypothetical protein M3018_09390, partial [Actinomycetota bacterium]|nr:hypothetical protein [Actinomycetota bacterium]
MVKRSSWLSSSWLSLTPEPERELPRLVATLRHGGPPSPELVGTEEARLDRLVLHGSEGAWLRYLHGVVELVDSDSLVESPEVASARART